MDGLVSDPANRDAEAHARTHQGAGLPILYASFFGFLGVATPFFPLWLSSRGLDARWVGACSACVIFAATLGQLLLPRLAIRSGPRLTAIVATLAAIVATGFLTLLPSGSPASVVALAVVAGLFTGSLIPLSDAIALAPSSADYGRIRAVGSFGFAASSIGAGWIIDLKGPAAIIPAEMALLGMTLAGLVMLGRRTESIAPPPDVGSDRLDLHGPWRRADLWLLITAVAAINAGHAYYYLFADIHWTRVLGLSATTTGLLWAVGVAAEVGVLWLAGRRDDMRGAIRLMLVGSVAGVIRWTMSAIDPPLLILFLLQLLHGLTFGATLLGGMQAIRKLVGPRQMTTVLGVFAAVVHGVVIGGLTVALGYWFDARSAAGFLVMAGSSAVGGLLVLSFAIVRARQRDAG